MYLSELYVRAARRTPKTSFLKMYLFRKWNCIFINISYTRQIYRQGEEEGGQTDAETGISQQKSDGVY